MFIYPLKLICPLPQVLPKNAFFYYFLKKHARQQTNSPSTFCGQLDDDLQKVQTFKKLFIYLFYSSP